MSFPNLHPLIIHFPIVLWFTGLLFSFIEFIFPAKWSITKAAYFLYGLAGLAAVVAWLTGRQAADTEFIPPEAQTVLSTHADSGLITMIVIIVMSAIFLILNRIDRWNEVRVFKGLNVLGSAAVAILIGYTADLGGQLVFTHGIGTQPLDQRFASGAAGTVDTEKAVFIQYPDGGWRWQSGQDSRASIRNNFTVDEFSAISDNDTLLVIPPAKTTETFTFNLNYPEIYQDVQVYTRINPAEFTGLIDLTYHVQASGEYDFLRITNDEIKLGRTEQNGKDTIFDTSPVPDGADWITVSVVGAGRHFRGYINDDLIVHGHAKELSPGSTGLILNGSGQVKIDWIEVQPLKTEH